MCCHVKEMISSFFIFIYTQTMLFKQGDVAAKVGKTELYVSGGLLDEGHHIFSGEPFENNPSNIELSYQSMSITWKCLLKVKSNPFANSTSYSFLFISIFFTACAG